MIKLRQIVSPDLKALMGGFFLPDDVDIDDYNLFIEGNSLFFFALELRRGTIDAKKWDAKMASLGSEALQLNRGGQIIQLSNDDAKFQKLTKDHRGILEELRGPPHRIELTREELLLFQTHIPRTPICPFCNCTSDILISSLRNPQDPRWKVAKKYFKHRWGIDLDDVSLFSIFFFSQFFSNFSRWDIVLFMQLRDWLKVSSVIQLRIWLRLELSWLSGLLKLTDQEFKLIRRSIYLNMDVFFLQTTQSSRLNFV